MGYFLYLFGSNPDEIWGFYHAITMDAGSPKACMVGLFVASVSHLNSTLAILFHKHLPSNLHGQCWFTLALMSGF
jgi:hypothetical protein